MCVLKLDNPNAFYMPCLNEPLILPQDGIAQKMTNATQIQLRIANLSLFEAI